MGLDLIKVRKMNRGEINKLIPVAKSWPGFKDYYFMDAKLMEKYLPELFVSEIPGMVSVSMDHISKEKFLELKEYAVSGEKDADALINQLKVLPDDYTITIKWHGLNNVQIPDEEVGMFKGIHLLPLERVELVKTWNSIIEYGERFETMPEAEWTEFNKEYHMLLANSVLKEMDKEDKSFVYWI